MIAGEKRQTENGYSRKLSRSSGGIPDSTKASLHQKLVRRQRERWPQLKDVLVRFRARFAYVDGVMPDGDVQPLCRLRYLGDANDWGFAFFAASSGSYEDSILPSGSWLGLIPLLVKTQIFQRSGGRCAQITVLNTHRDLWLDASQRR